jgi:hypothetical protein
MLSLWGAFFSCAEAKGTTLVDAGAGADCWTSAHLDFGAISFRKRQTTVSDR